MTKFVMSLALVVSGGSVLACPDEMKAMDAKAPTGQKLVVAEQPAWSQARSEAPKAKALKSNTKPAVAAVSPAEAKKPSGV